jgi:hypothetical protein
MVDGPGGQDQAGGDAGVAFTASPPGTFAAVLARVGHLDREPGGAVAGTTPAGTGGPGGIPGEQPRAGRSRRGGLPGPAGWTGAAVR